MPDSKTGPVAGRKLGSGKRKGGADIAGETLAEIRQKIDRIDEQLLELLNARARCAEAVAEVKSSPLKADEAGKGTEPTFYRPEREAQILQRVMAENRGPLPDAAVARLFREIISCCLSLEQVLSVAYLGPAGTYTQAAAIKHFGQFANTHSVKSIGEVFREVASARADYGVVPVENSTEGMINLTLDCLLDSTLNICSEVELPIHQALMANPDSRIEDIEAIYSHPQSLAQCREWLATHWGEVELKAVSSNAEAARLVSERTDAAAIAGEMAAEEYGLQLLARNIEDQPQNKTRFLVLGRQKVESCGNDKTSLVVSVRNEPGALYRILEPFQRHQVDLTRLESRPARSGDWSYVFFMDFNGHESDETIAQLISEIDAVADSLRVLGSYPQASL